MLRMATSPASGRGEERSIRLHQPLLRYRDAHLALLRLHEIGEREHRPVGSAAQKADDHEEANQTGHRDNSSPRRRRNEKSRAAREDQTEATNHHVRAKLARAASSRYMLAQS